MDPKLLVAIIERIKAGVSESDIKQEVMGSGYDENTFSSAYAAALSMSGQEPSSTSGVMALSEDLLQINRLFRVSWQMCQSNFALLVKAIFTIGVCFAGLAAGSFYLYTSLTGPTEGVVFYIAVTLLLALAFILVIVTSFATIVRALLRRNAGEAFFEHLKWAFVHIIGITLVSCYVSILTQVGYLVFFLPGIVLTVLLIFSTFYVIEGSYKGVASLVASTELIYGRFFKVFGRVLLSMAVYFAVMLGAILLTSVFWFLNPLLMVVAMGLMFVLMFVGFFWQLCFTIALFEALKSTPVSEEKPVSSRFLQTAYQIVIVIVFGGLMIIAFFFGFFATSLGLLDGFETELLDEMESTSDVAYKQTVRAATLDADFYQLQNGTYQNVCTYLTLSAETTCQSTASAYAIETPLSWGFYCVDSMGYNEVSTRSVLQNSSCTEVEI